MTSEIKMGLEMNSMEEEVTMQNKTILRVSGFSILAAIVVAIGYVFYSPGILSGSTGVFFPIGLFALLLISFYLLILSTK